MISGFRNISVILIEMIIGGLDPTHPVTSESLMWPLGDALQYYTAVFNRMNPYHIKK